ncbi:nuclear transport factor 2 family protein [Rhodococcus sp. 3Y1]
MTSDKLITDFCALWAAADVAKIVDYFTDDVVYHNIPMEPVVGREAVRAFIEQFVECLRQHRLSDQASGRGRQHRHERAHRRLHHQRRRGSAPGHGVFEVEDGKIKAWRDYFDMAPINAAAGQA